MEDKKIVELFFMRDENAIKQTDIKYGAKLHSLSLNITGNGADAEECVNDTYLAAWNNIPPTRPDNFPSYLFRIIRNISYNLFHKNTTKKRSANLFCLTEELSEIIPDTSPNIFDESELSRAIDDFLRKTDTDTRILFVRRYFYSDTLPSLSSLTGMSENAIAARLFRARKNLKKYLEKEGFNI